MDGGARALVAAPRRRSFHALRSPLAREWRRASAIRPSAGSRGALLPDDGLARAGCRESGRAGRRPTSRSRPVTSSVRKQRGLAAEGSYCIRSAIGRRVLVPPPTWLNWKPISASISADLPDDWCPTISTAGASNGCRRVSCRSSFAATPHAAQPGGEGGDRVSRHGSKKREMRERRGRKATSENRTRVEQSPRAPHHHTACVSRVGGLGACHRLTHDGEGRERHNAVGRVAGPSGCLGPLSCCRPAATSLLPSEP